jgi:hypothetical protein
MVRYVNSKKRRLIARLASLLAVLVMIPAGITFYKVFKASLFKRDVNNFMDEKIAPYQFSGEGKFLKDFSDVVYNDGENPKLELVFVGNEAIPENVIATWRNQMNEYKQLKNSELMVLQDQETAKLVS